MGSPETAWRIIAHPVEGRGSLQQSSTGWAFRCSRASRRALSRGAHLRVADTVESARGRTGCPVQAGDSHPTQLLVVTGGVESNEHGRAPMGIPPALLHCQRVTRAAPRQGSRGRSPQFGDASPAGRDEEDRHTAVACGGPHDSQRPCREANSVSAAAGPCDLDDQGCPGKKAVRRPSKPRAHLAQAPSWIGS